MELVKENNKNTLGISVIICCYNSANRLPQTLQYLSHQLVSNATRWEIVIVDNASTDDTAQIAREILIRFSNQNFSFQIVKEKKPGLSFARHTGVRNALYDVVIFCDDDNWLDKSYLQHAIAIINSDKTIGALGGQGYVTSDVQIPDWFEEYKGSYAIGKQGEVTGYVTQREYVWGAGLVTKKDLFLSTINEELPSLLTDRKGNELTSGGDNEYCQRLILLGYQLYYSEDLIFGHYMPANRLTIEYRDKLVKCQRECSMVVYQYTEAIRLKNTKKITKIKLLFYALKHILASVFRRKKIHSRCMNIIFYFFGVGYNIDKDIRMIKHFYDASRKSFS
ncbi:MAG: glycosyltransferase family 2 protein [Flavobacterium sp.]|nr:MAG: glycosyltransferase family 2 protein [Flavobacterium sp.]